MTRPGPETVRFPAGSDTPAWYEEYAKAHPPATKNGLMVEALDQFRAALEDGAAPESPPERISA